MNPIKYRLLFGYDGETFKFEKEEFDSIDKAVKAGIELTRYHYTPFLIVTIIDWISVES